MSKNLDMFSSNDKQSLNIIIFDYQSKNAIYISSLLEQHIKLYNKSRVFDELFPELSIIDVKSKIDNSLDKSYQHNLEINGWKFEFVFYNAFLMNRVMLVSTVKINSSNFDELLATIERLPSHNKFAVGMLDEDLKFIAVNEQYHQTFNIEEKINGKPFCFNIINCSYQQHTEIIRKSVIRDGHWYGSVVAQRRDKIYKPYFILIRKDLQNGENQNYYIYYFPLYHSSDKKIPINISLENNNGQVYSRSYFEGIVNKKLQKPTASKYILFIDINEFKMINDQFGHLAGDQSVKKIGDIIYETFNEHIVGRYGGDEFTVYVDGEISLNEIVSKVKLADKRIKKNVKHLPNKTRYTISCGISRYPNNGLSLTKLIDSADKAMYKAKNNNKLFEVSFDKD